MRVLILIALCLSGCADRNTYRLKNGSVIKCGSRVKESCGVHLSDCTDDVERICETDVEVLT